MDLFPCGTGPVLDPGTAAFLRANPYARPNLSDTLWVGLQIHLLGRDEGTGHLSAIRLLEAFNRLNLDFAASAVQFYFKYDWNYIDSTAWFAHDTIAVGRDMMFAMDVPDATNCYFVSSAAGNCGYNLPYASVAMAFSCTGPNDHTWTHEMGHQYGVPHPFRGWEGTFYSPAQPTPLYLLYDYTHFHSTPDSVNAPLDTALVEYVDGRNCTESADLICDTRPDYLAYRWNCNPQGNSTVKQVDPDGQEFFSDGTLYMSYAADNCQNRFSDQQVAVMRNNLQVIKPMVLAPSRPAFPVAGAPVLLAPVGGATAPNQQTVFQWAAAPGATGYVLQVSRFPNFFILEINDWTRDTSWISDKNLTANQTYYWRVKPFNMVDGGAPFTASGTFKAGQVLTAVETNAGGWRLYPTLLEAGQSLWLEHDGQGPDEPVLLTVFDPLGRLLWQEKRPVLPLMRIDLPATDHQRGLFRLLLQNSHSARTMTFLRG